MTNWTCETCNITIKSGSKYRHVKSKKHLQKSNPLNSLNPLKEIEECTICTEPMTTRKNCRACHQSWCRKCDRNIAKCPYCREQISGRDFQAFRQERENYNWYASSDAFVPQPERFFLFDIIEIIQRHMRN